MEDIHTTVIDTLNYVLNVACILCGLSAATIILMVMWLDRAAMDRVSIRFTLAVAVVDALNAGMILFYTLIHDDTGFCTFISLASHWLMLFYLFLNVCIALNLQLVFVHGLVLGRRFEYSLWAGTFLLPTVLMLFGLASGRYGFDVDSQYCEIRDPLAPTSIVTVWTTFLGWALASIVYCAIAVTLVMVSLRTKASAISDVCLKKGSRHLLQDNCQLKRKIHKLIKRISLYCIIPVVTQSGYLVLRVILSYTDELPLVIRYVSVIGSDITGILNLMVLFVDPAFTTAIQSIIKSHSRGSPEPSVMELEDGKLENGLIDDNCSHLTNQYCNESMATPLTHKPISPDPISTQTQAMRAHTSSSTFTLSSLVRRL
ncbi:hypothetical protein L0F63_001422 [Massospora cicadina]|nr:hypothetical protein L0F63_001422 [Massospora cicadina]